MISHTFNEIIEKKYLHIGEVAEMLGINTPALRYWCGMFGIIPKRSRGNERLFSCEDIEKLKEVKRLLKVEGYKIEGAKHKLSRGYAVGLNQEEHIDKTKI